MADEDRGVIPGQLAFDGLCDPFAEDRVWGSHGMARLMAGAPRPDGHGSETLDDKYKTEGR